MNEVTNILIKSSFNVSQLKLLIALISYKPKTILDLANILEVTAKKIINEIKKLEHDEIEITINEDTITVEIALDKYVLSSEKSSKNKLITKADEKESLAKDIFEFWRSTILNPNGQKKKTRFSTYKSTILGALKNYSEEEIKSAILGCSKSLWNMGYDDKGNPTNKRYDGLDLILRANKIEGFILRKDQLSVEAQLNKINNNIKTASDEGSDSWANNRNSLMG